jgi:hypothetical protein
MEFDEAATITVKTVDALFRLIAEKTVASENVSLEEAQEGMWALLERGFLKLVDSDDSLGVEPCTSRNERRLAAKGNRALVSYRRRLLAKVSS